MILAPISSSFGNVKVLRGATRAWDATRVQEIFWFEKSKECVHVCTSSICALTGLWESVNFNHMSNGLGILRFSREEIFLSTKIYHVKSSESRVSAQLISDNQIFFIMIFAATVTALQLWKLGDQNFAIG